MKAKIFILGPAGPECGFIITFLDEFDDGTGEYMRVIPECRYPNEQAALSAARRVAKTLGLTIED